MAAETAAQGGAAAAVVGFWHAAGPDRWFAKDPAFDALFRDRYAALHFAAARREQDGWSATPEGSLALAILLDQYPRNAFRGTGHMYATDPLARMFARRAIAAGHDRAIEPALRLFLDLPFAHSEDMADQDLSVALAAALPPPNPAHAARHRGIVARFGRFPHRNPMLGRATTDEEQAWLDGGGYRG